MIDDIDFFASVSLFFSELVEQLFNISRLGITGSSLITQQKSGAKTPICVLPTIIELNHPQGLFRTLYVLEY